MVKCSIVLYGALNPLATHISLSSSETWLNWDLRQKAKQRAGLKIENFDLFWTYSINRHYEFSSRNIFPHPKNWKQTINKTAAFVFALLLGSSTQLCEDSVCLVPTPFYVFAHHIINSSKRPWLVPRWHGFEVRFSLHLLMETQLKQLVLSLYVSNSD